MEKEIMIVLTEKQLKKLVCGGLKNTLNAHGQITPELIGSAEKRITGLLIGWTKNKECIEKCLDGEKNEC